MTSNGRCRSCRRTVRWVETAATGKKMPLNPLPDLSRGNVRMRPDGKAEVLNNDAAAVARSFGDDLYLSHFATCSAAKNHRRR